MAVVSRNRAERLQRNAAQAAELLKSMAHEGRLLALCQLIGTERSVGQLEESTGLSQSALSQHLARLRAQGLVAARRKGQSVFYALADERATRVIQALYAIYCQ
ncbi:MAG: metalloregulator ArsR/SmtB family transcription factor [Leptospirales bacterium]|nr:metalloregulator ArsR/SmtB family transcription factor [Leptospirales bacterium]